MFGYRGMVLKGIVLVFVFLEVLCNEIRTFIKLLYKKRFGVRFGEGC